MSAPYICPTCQTEADGDRCVRCDQASQSTTMANQVTPPAPGPSIDHSAGNDTTAYLGSTDHYVSPETTANPSSLAPIELSYRVADPTTPLSPESLTTESDRLIVRNEIGRGGMATVLRGLDSKIGREVAVKVLHEHYRGRPEQIRRFIEEARICGQLQHFGVVPVYEMGEFEDHVPYFTMKLIRGETFAAVLKARERPSDDLARMLSIFQQVCQTVAYAHARRVIHRDLKPLNIMVGAFGEVQVMDWGLAKVLRTPAEPAAGDLAEPVINIAESEELHEELDHNDHNASRVGGVLGTPSYLSPEQARGEGDLVDERTDVFALGATLCEILTGDPAYLGPSGLVILGLARRGELASTFRRLDQSGAEPELIALARDCLAIDREARPRNAGVLADRLTRYFAEVQDRLRSAEIAKVEAQARAEEEQKRRVLADELVVHEQNRLQMAVRLADHERSRRRVTMGLAASILALLGVAVGSAAWYLEQRNQRIDRARDLIVTARTSIDSAEAADDAASAAPDEERAKLALAQARQIAEASQLPLIEATEARLQHADRARTLIARLEQIRALEETGAEGSMLDAQYAQAFEHFGLDLDRASTSRIAEELAGRAWSYEVADAVDLWFEVRRKRLPQQDRARVDTLGAAARAIDPNPWRTRLVELLEQPGGAPLNELRDRANELASLPRSTASEIVRLAHLLRERGDPATALKLLQRGWDRFPNDYWINYHLGHWSTGGGGDHLHEVDNVKSDEHNDEAVRYLTAAVTARPDSPQAHSCLAHALEASGRIDDALAQLEVSIKLDPSDAATRRRLASLLLHRGQTDRAEAAYREGLRVAPREVSLLVGLARTLENQCKYDEALQYAEQARKHEPNRADTTATLGLILLSTGKSDEGLGLIETAVAMAPTDAATQRIYGNALVQLGRASEALPHLLEAVRLSPKSAEAACDLGDALLRVGRVDDADRAFQNALRLKPNLFEARTGLATLLSARGKGDAAFTEWNKLLSERPNDIKLHAHVGMNLSQQGKLDEAISHFRKAVDAQPNFYEMQFNLGTSLLELGDRQGAARHLTAAVRLRPESAEAHCKLAAALSALGEYEQALKEYREGHALGSKQPGWRFPSAQWVADAERSARMAPRLARVLAGEQQPGTAQEALELIRLCRERGMLDSVVHLYEQAFSLDPHLADDPVARHRILAAAAIASSADQPRSAQSHALALGWLQTELSNAKTQAAAGDTRALEALRALTSDPRFASVRNQATLDRLPPAAQAGWRDFWKSIEPAQPDPKPKS